MSERVTFHHYRVCRRDDGSLWELGRGSAGVTYKARDANLDFPVALKVLNAELFRDDAARAAFVREARAAAQLRHRNIASVYHLGNDIGHLFYAMEFIEGETARTLVKREGPLPVVTALSIARQVARALAAAERHGIIHRDIKPAKLMLSSADPNADEGLLVKVIDFGMAYLPKAGPPSERGSGGTSHYASPEQAEEEVVDGRSDLYSLGCTLWFLLTGNPPFNGTLASILVQRIHGEPNWDDLKHVPSAVVKLLRILIRKNPTDRPGNATEVQRAIEMCLGRVQRGRALHLRLGAGLAHTQWWFLSRPGRRSVAGMILLGAVAAVVLTLSTRWREPDANFHPTVSSVPSAAKEIQKPDPVSEKLELGPIGRPSRGLESAPLAQVRLDKPVPPGSSLVAEPEPDPASDGTRAASGPPANSPHIASIDAPSETVAPAEKPESKPKHVQRHSHSHRPMARRTVKKESNPLVRFDRSLRGLLGRLF